ncbi:hypothetical protein VTN96DRAFT_3631 [Rasamsonia emersonii]|uniref:NADPH-dependent FMN reductase-like domain-containing protein n=1 Tax=Rasamsonia emersonii (strain ATCC 16479 / CBS 393.64 / IMI 116815) TaxID=1408163 RepID=A0A0F4YFI9_RASE3|nr:hypothetical protein T310_9360 [Rasamsonia emersonii CBS 393.64]KKA17017.1 hypothetical protein T310_9360 [Rasamsonia emersonii CBS 393.64]
MSATTVKKIAIIATSTRTPRVGPSVAAWVHDVLQQNKDKNNNDNNSTIELHQLSVADFNLPVFDEPVLPANVPSRASFTHEHSKRWSSAIAQHDGYVLVIPEYNYGVAGGTKNAIDYLYNEWIGKPVLVVSYGVQGGKGASRQLSEILEGMKLKVVPTRPNLAFKGGLGPDAFAAMNEGRLGEETKAEWEAGDAKEQVLRGFAELRELL